MFLVFPVVFPAPNWKHNGNTLETQINKMGCRCQPLKAGATRVVVLTFKRQFPNSGRCSNITKEVLKQQFCLNSVLG